MNTFLMWLSVALGAVGAFLSILLKSKDKALRDKEGEVESLKRTVESVEKAAKADSIAKAKETEHAVKAAEISKKQAKAVEEAVEAEDPTEFYNGLVEGWNEED